MKKRVLISILSHHLVPNYLFIREMEGLYDELIFLTTEAMLNAKKNNNLEEALGLEKDSILCVVLKEDDFSENLKSLEKASFSANHSYLVNITGGTKLMSLATLTHFRVFDKATFYYLPIGKNQIHRLDKGSTLSISSKLTLKAYFLLYGIHIDYSEPLGSTFETPNELFRRFQAVSFQRKQLRDIYDADMQPTAEARSFYLGGWFEEYIYHYLKRTYDVDDDQIACGLEIFREGSTNADNEIDVAMIKDNSLYIFECKVGLHGNKQAGGFSPTLEKSLYKLAAIAKDFGLQVNSYLLTLHRIFNNNRLPPETIANIKKRQKILGIKEIIDHSFFIKDKFKI